MIIKRNVDLHNIKKLLDIFHMVAILGVRQCGKTTISKGKKTSLTTFSPASVISVSSVAKIIFLGQGFQQLSAIFD